MSLSNDTTSYLTLQEDHSTPCHRYRTLLNLVDPLALLTWSSQMYDTSIPMLATWFTWRLELIWTLISTLVLNTTPKNVLLLILLIKLLPLDWDNLLNPLALKISFLESMFHFYFKTLLELLDPLFTQMWNIYKALWDT